MKKARLISFLLASLLIFNSSPALAEDPSPPGPPQNLIFYNLTGKSVRLDWDAPETGTVTRYHVYKYVDGTWDFLYDPIFTLYDVTGLTPGTTYKFKVCAVNDTLEGPFSNEVILTTENENGIDGNAEACITYPPDGQRFKVPPEIQGTAADPDGTVMAVGLWITDSQGRYLSGDLSAFEDAANPGDYPTGYRIPVQNTGTNYSAWTLDLGGSPAFIDGRYRVKVCASDGIYNTGGVQQIEFVIDTIPPAAPAGLTADDITGTGLTLSWEAPASGDAEKYNLYINGQLYTSTSRTNVNVNGLTPGALYLFTVTAHDGLDESLPAPVLEVTTPFLSPGNAAGMIEYPLPKKKSNDNRAIYKKLIELEDGTFKVKVKVWNESIPNSIRQSQAHNYSINMTNYFPGKQISKESIWIENEFICRAVREKKDILITGNLAGIELKTSQSGEPHCSGGLEFSAAKVGIPGVLENFLEEHKGFSAMSDALSIDFNNFCTSIPVNFTLTVENYTSGSYRIGFIRVDEDGGISCCYNGVRIDALNATISVEGPGTFTLVTFENPYSDIIEHWAEDEVINLLSMGMCKGNGNCFCPDQAIAREDFVEMLAGATGVKVEEIAYNKGFYITRKEAVEIIVKVYEEAVKENALGVKHVELNGHTPGVSDNIPLKPDLQPYIDRAKQLGLVIGYEDGSFRPDACTTRAEAAVMVNRLMKLIRENNDLVLQRIN